MISVQPVTDLVIGFPAVTTSEEAGTRLSTWRRSPGANVYGIVRYTTCGGDLMGRKENDMDKDFRPTEYRLNNGMIITARIACTDGQRVGSLLEQNEQKLVQILC